MLRIYDSYSNKKQEFKPIKKNHIGMYVCGITVYDLCHVGHGRTFTSFDVIYRYLKFSGYEVTFVRNITDIDDKIIKRSNENNELYSDLVDRMIIEMNKDFDSLNLLKPTYEPKATESIKEIIEICQSLTDKGYTYINSDGDLLFRVNKFDDYGKLSKQNLDSLKSSERNLVSTDKESSADFVLWKKSKQGEPAWSSPWGEGRPGWHIECSAMTYKTLGSNFDIHAGGSDLMFPHHENEIAQSCCAHSDKYANYWLHSGMVNVDGEKMSKSLNNFFTLRTLLEMYNPESIRYFFITSHYRSILKYTEENLNIANSSLTRLYSTIRGYQSVELSDKDETYIFVEKFIESMDDDFNTPQALSILFDLVREVNKFKTAQQLDKFNLYASRLVYIANILGILYQDPEIFLTYNNNVESKLVEDLINQRKQARLNKDWVLSDQIRDKLNELNVIIEDGADGTKWRFK